MLPACFLPCKLRSGIRRFVLNGFTRAVPLLAEYQGHAYEFRRSTRLRTSPNQLPIAPRKSELQRLCQRRSNSQGRIQKGNVQCESPCKRENIAARRHAVTTMKAASHARRALPLYLTAAVPIRRPRAFPKRARPSSRCSIHSIGRNHPGMPSALRRSACFDLQTNLHLTAETAPECALNNPLPGNLVRRHGCTKCSRTRR